MTILVEVSVAKILVLEDGVSLVILLGLRHRCAAFASSRSTKLFKTTGYQIKTGYRYDGFTHVRDLTARDVIDQDSYLGRLFERERERKSVS